MNEPESRTIETAREIALRFIDFQPRTSREVRNRLMRAKFEEDVVDSVVADLERAGLLNDSEFSEAWVESRARSKGIGRRRLASELIKRGVDKSAIQSALETLPEEAEIQNAMQLAEKKAKSDDLTDPAARRRLAGFLQRRGYNWGIIEQVFEKMGANSEGSP